MKHIEFFKNGKRHRMDGPAYITPYAEHWFINDHVITNPITKWAKERNIDLNNLTEEDKAAIIMEWSHIK